MCRRSFFSLLFRKRARKGCRFPIISERKDEHMPNCKTVVPYRGTPQQEEQLRQIIAEHKGQPGATMPVLQAAQEIFGYLPEEVQIIVAEGLEIPLSEVYGVASF